MRSVPWWGVLSASAAPVLLVGGWTVAAARQPVSFDPVVDTISALAAFGAADRWIMTAALVGVGACHVTTAAALHPAARGGRVVLAAGGVATVLVAATPLPDDGSGSAAHGMAAAVAFLALSVWPVAAISRGPGAPTVLRPVVAITASAALLGLLGWFAVEQISGGDRVGLSERVAAGAQALWPLAVVLGCRRR